MIFLCQYNLDYGLGFTLAKLELETDFLKKVSYLT